MKASIAAAGGVSGQRNNLSNGRFFSPDGGDRGINGVSKFCVHDDTEYQAAFPLSKAVAQGLPRVLLCDEKRL